MNLPYNEIEFELDKNCIGIEFTFSLLPHGLYKKRRRHNFWNMFLPKHIGHDLLKNIITKKTIMSIDTYENEIIKLQKNLLFPLI